MTVQDLIQELASLSPRMEIMVLDGENGGGHPRAINLGPVKHTITTEDAEETGDNEDQAGDVVYVIGFGCY